MLPVEGMRNNQILHGDCLNVLPTLQNETVSLVITSPVYAMQRRKQYGGIPESEYPAWTCAWMERLRPKLRQNASIVINIRPHVRDGCISDYVLRTRLAIRDCGWFEIDELIWFQPDKPPLGHIRRPRRAYESLLWYSNSKRPYVDPFAAGTPLLHPWGGLRSKYSSGKSPIHGGQRTKPTRDSARMTDVIRGTTGTIDRNVLHPAMMPRDVVRPLVKLLSRPGDLVLDPMVGSGTVPLVCRELGRQYIGIDRKIEYVRLARRRLQEMSDR
ncbi:hypothetical protein BH09PLA1_BH09PLA1_01450 [soil metagenome]